MTGDKIIGRTPTHYKTLAPEWNTTFDGVKLFSLDTTIEMKVFDEETYKSDDPMGLVSLSLADVLLNTEVLMVQPLEQLGTTIVAAGHLVFSIFVEKSQDVVRIVQKEATGKSSEHEQAHEKERREYIDHILRHLSVMPSQPVQRILNEYPLATLQANEALVLDVSLSWRYSATRRAVNVSNCGF
jgi:hypothetical protein